MRLCYRLVLAKALEVWQHIGLPKCYLLEDKNGVTPLCSLKDVERKLRAMTQERAKRKAGSEVA
jgi:hypothetical protein